MKGPPRLRNKWQRQSASTSTSWFSFSCVGDLLPSIGLPYGGPNGHSSVGVCPVSRCSARGWTERAGHLLGVEEPLLPHHVLEEAELALIDEQHQFAGFREVGLGC